MGKILALFFIIFIIFIYGKALPKKRVCIIGAGRAGLAAVKTVVDQRENFDVISFERNSDVGGLWIYRDSPDLDEHGLPAHSGIYKHLKTNIPKSDMAYPDYPHFEGEENSEFVSHKMVLEYLKNYTAHFQLRKHIQFDTLVTKVYPIRGKGDWKTTTWHLEVRNLITAKENTVTCDAVLVCNGRFSKPNIPKIPGMETFPGQKLHSRAYRKPDDFANKTVVILGAGASGIEISKDLSHYARLVYLSHRHNNSSLYSGECPANVRVTRGVVSANGNELTLQDNSTILADTFIYCTGYVFDFPFLDHRSGLVVGKKEISPLFQHFLNVEHPSMALISLTGFLVDYGELYYKQTKAILELLQGKLELPSYEEMLEYSKAHDVFIGENV